MIQTKKEIIREVQKVQFEILKEVDRICRKNNIRYILFSGSMLGAVRHQGFIPWDDDIDIAMLRDDYERLIDVIDDELSSDYFFQTHRKDKKNFFSYGKVRKNNTLLIEKSIRHLKMHHGIFLDVFPLDNYFPNDRKMLSNVRKINLLTEIKLRSHTKFVYNKNKLLMQLPKIALRIFRIPLSFYNRRIDKLAAMFNNQESEYVNLLIDSSSKSVLERFIMKKKDVTDTIDILFEGGYFPVPKKYDELLTKCFGNYMELPPKENQKPGHATEVSLDGTNLFGGFDDFDEQY